MNQKTQSLRKTLLVSIKFAADLNWILYSGFLLLEGVVVLIFIERKINQFQFLNLYYGFLVVKFIMAKKNITYKTEYKIPRLILEGKEGDKKRQNKKTLNILSLNIFKKRC